MRTVLTAMATIALAAIGPAGAVAGGGGGGGGGPCRAYTPESRVDRVVLRDFCFDPVTAPVAGGTELTVVNAGDQPHTLTAADGSFDTGVIEPGGTVTVTVDGDGLTPVYCTLHATRAGSGMAGTLVASAGSVQPAADQPAGSAAATLTGQPGWKWLVAGLALGLAARSAWRRLRPT